MDAAAAAAVLGGRDDRQAHSPI